MFRSLNTGRWFPGKKSTPDAMVPLNFAVDASLIKKMLFSVNRINFRDLNFDENRGHDPHFAPRPI